MHNYCWCKVCGLKDQAMGKFKLKKSLNEIFRAENLLYTHTHMQMFRIFIVKDYVCCAFLQSFLQVLQLNIFCFNYTFLD